MGLVKRQLGDRRWGMSVEYPLTDCDDLLVTRNRRLGDDRRKSIATPDDLQILFSQLPSVDPGKKH